MTLETIRENFALLDDWEDRYRYVIELGRDLPAMRPDLKSDATKVRGCASQVWLSTEVHPGTGGEAPQLSFTGDSDAMIVKGLIAILFAIYDSQPADKILTIDPEKIFQDFGLIEHLTPQRSNGLRSMVERVRADAAKAVA